MVQFLRYIIDPDMKIHRHPSKINFPILQSVGSGLSLVNKVVGEQKEVAVIDKDQLIKVYFIQ